MINVWENIDPKEAESRLETLYRRISDLEQAIQAQSELLALEPNSFAFKTSQISLLREQDFLQDKLSELLRYRINEAITFNLNGPGFRDHAADFSDLSYFLLFFQKLFTSASHALLVGPTRRGPIPADIEGLSRIQIVATAPGSFEIAATIPSRTDLVGENRVVFALEKLFDFLTAKEENAIFLSWAGDLGSRSLGHYRRLINHLIKTETIPQMEWRNPSGIQKNWRPTYESINRVRKIINDISEESTEQEIHEGRLVGASLIRRRFEFLTKDDTMISGRFAVDSTSKITSNFGKLCAATIVRNTYLDRVTTEERASFTMVDVVAV